MRIWHGSRDANAPIESLREIAARMPHCVLKEFNDTHFSVGRHYEEVLREIVSDFQRTQELRSGETMMVNNEEVRNRGGGIDSEEMR